MLVYEKKVDGERHLFGKVQGTVPSEDDVQLTYKDTDGTTITPELSDTYLNDGHGGIVRKSDGEAINVFIGETQIIGGEITPTVASLRIDKNPTKVTFTEGEQLEYYGIEITLVYSDGTEEGVSEDPALTFDPDWGTTATVDMTSVTVTHTTYNVSTSFAITVEAETITRTVDMNGGTAGGESICVDEVQKGLDWVPDLWYSQNHSTWTIPEGKAWDGVTTVKDDESTKISHMVLDSDCTFYVLWKDA